MTVSIRETRPDSAAAQDLLQALYAAQMALYPRADPAEADPAEHSPPHGVFLIAYDQEKPVGCGAVRTYAEHVAEVRKMFVTPSHRGTGVGQLILAALEEFASTTLGAERILLETGVRNEAAQRLYTSAGYIRRASYVDGRGPVNRAFEKALPATRHAEFTVKDH